MAYLNVTTRPAAGEKYPADIANSVHFLYKCSDSEEGVFLNHSYGILFAKAELTEEDTIDSRSLTEPKIIVTEAGYVIMAQETDGDGINKNGNLILFRTKDFVSFEEQEKVSYESMKEIYEAADCEIEVTEEQLTSIRYRWEAPHDGNSDHDNREPVVFPMAVGWADPVIFCWEGSWYFLATNDNNNNVGLFVRKADSVKGLFDENTEPVRILDYNEEKNYIQTFWAPEFHLIGGELYILFAVGGKVWAPQCHMMKLKKGGEINNPADWEEPIRVCKKDGSFLTEDAITLDMTYFKVQEISYVMWSYRERIGTPLDSGSMICIATVDEKEPWKLTSDPILVARPLYGWENTAGTINNEGPYALISGDKIYVAYSGGSANGYSYAIGYLVADLDADLLDPKNWKKEPAPVLASTYIDGIEGPGHNSFFRNEKGQLMIAYHAQEFEKYNARCTTMHGVHIGNNGFPYLDVAD